MSNKAIIYIVVSVIVLIIVLSGNPFYVVHEGVQVIITQFGKPMGDAVVNAGLHLKFPFIQKVNQFEKRILEWDGYPTEIPTKDKRYIFVDTTARWIITDPLKFFQSVYNERGAQAKLDDIIDSEVRNAVTAYNLTSIVRSSNRILEMKEDLEKISGFIDEGALERITIGREEIRQKVLDSAKKLTSRYGIELLDIRIKKVNYIESVRKKVYERMITERKRAAEQYRSEGRGIRAEIEGKTGKELKGILSEAYKNAQVVKGEADAESTQIYADAYNQDKELFFFLKTLETYKNTINESSTLILTTDADYFKYLKTISP